MGLNVRVPTDDRLTTLHASRNQDTFLIEHERVTKSFGGARSDSLTMNLSTKLLSLTILYHILNVSTFQTKRLSFVQQKRQGIGLSSLPKLIVFDLDNTLWTPALYQLRKKKEKNFSPRAGDDVKLMDGSKEILEHFVPKLQEQGVQFAVASRTKSVEWAYTLLKQFGIQEMMNYVEIFPGTKRKHFKNMRRTSGIEYDSMLFFDDARDGKFGNCEPISKMGVLSVHCPNGLDSVETFTTGLERYKEWDKSSHMIVESDGTMTNVASVNAVCQKGVVRKVNEYKQYGFIRFRRGNSRDIFFPFRNLAGNTTPIEGQKVSFDIQLDPKSGKKMAGNVVLEDSNSEGTVTMRCFSMNQPFASLLMNGYKTLETRNGTMFSQYVEGTQLLLHIGRRNYPDGGKHIEVMKSDGLNDDEIAALKTLPQGYGRGNVVAIVEIGRTYEVGLEDRSDPDFQRKAVAYGEDSGKMVTEIRRVMGLKRPVKLPGQSGVFNVQINPEVIPDGWHIPSNGNLSALLASIAE